MNNSADSADTTPPNDQAAEQAALGAMLLSSDAITEVTATLALTDYYRPAHATIHSTITAMHSAGQPVDPITVAARLRDAGDLHRVGGASYLHTLVQATPTAANGSYYAEIVTDLAKQRRLIATGVRLITHGREGSTGAEQIAARATAELATLGGAERWPDPIPLGTHAGLPVFPVTALTPWVAEHVSAVSPSSHRLRLTSRPPWDSPPWPRPPADAYRSRSAPAGASSRTSISSAPCRPPPANRTSSPR